VVHAAPAEETRDRGAARLGGSDDRIAGRRGRSIAVVALARRLAGILFAIWRDETVYDATTVRGPLPARRAA
jgi:hypothetical protein